MLTNVAINQLEQEYSRIMEHACGKGNDDTYACMLSSWQMSQGIMPDDFGMNAVEFAQLLSSHFPGLNPLTLSIPGRDGDIDRDNERDDVYKLLIAYRANLSVSEIWMAKIVATACQGQDHLWQDMGLWSRNQLSELLMRNFPTLASKNVKNMKWKKFIYKQLCNAEGIYACRAPSCEVCVDYDNCFSSED